MIFRGEGNSSVAGKTVILQASIASKTISVTGSADAAIIIIIAWTVLHTSISAQFLMLSVSRVAGKTLISIRSVASQTGRITVSANITVIESVTRAGRNAFILTEVKFGFGGSASITSQTLSKSSPAAGQTT